MLAPLALALSLNGQEGLAKTRKPAETSTPTPASSEISRQKAASRKTQWAVGYSWSGWSEELSLKTGHFEQTDLANYQSLGPKVSWSKVGSTWVWGVELGLGSNKASGGGQNTFGYKQSGYANSSFSCSIIALGQIGSGWLLGLAPQANFRPQEWVSNLSGLQVRHASGQVFFLPVRWLIPLTSSLALQQDFGPVVGSPYSFFNSALFYQF
jgi:hypothetical protein